MIPFIRYYPNGRTSQEGISRSGTVEHMARQFCRRGGQYLIAIHEDKTVELVAAMPVSLGRSDCFATASCYNDPVLPEAVDQLVRDSMAEVDRRERFH